MNTKYNDPRLETIVYGRIFKYKVTTNLDYYYNYTYHYNDKLFYDYKKIDKIDGYMVGKCFEVFIDPTNPSHSKMNLNKEIDCELYYVSFTTAGVP